MNITQACAYLAVRCSVSSTSNGWGTAGTNPWFAPLQEPGNMGTRGQRTASVAQNNGGNGECVGKILAFMWIEARQSCGIPAACGEGELKQTLFGFTA